MNSAVEVMTNKNRHAEYPESLVRGVIRARNKGDTIKEEGVQREIANLLDAGWTWSTTTTDGHAILVAPK